MILSAAVKFRAEDGLDRVWPLHRHEDFQVMLNTGLFKIVPHYTEFGFIAENPGRKKPKFVSPSEAKRIAIEERQPFLPGKENPFNTELLTTDLW